MAGCSTINEFNYTITMKSGETINVITRLPHEYELNKFLLLMPKGEKSNLLVDIDSIEKFNWVIK